MLDIEILEPMLVAKIDGEYWLRTKSTGLANWSQARLETDI
ncbi:uncharacterized protein METZ01_LOCUS264355, partial [marine metagenome]